MEALAELELKQRLAALTDEERRSISAYLLRLRQQSEAGRAETSRLMEAMDRGEKTPLAAVEPRSSEG